MQVSRGDYVRGWSKRRSLNDTDINIGSCMLTRVQRISCMRIAIKKVSDPIIIYTVRYFQMGELGHQLRMPD